MARFRQSLQEARFVEGRNMAIEYRWPAISPPPPNPTLTPSKIKLFDIR